MERMAAFNCAWLIWYAGVFGVQPASTHSDNETATEEKER